MISLRARLLWILLSRLVSPSSSLSFTSPSLIRGEIPIPDLSRPVTVTRDPWGVPSVRAGSARDLFCGVGYVMAADRLWQMDFLRRLASGRLSEILGDPDPRSANARPSAFSLRLPTMDLFYRALGLRALAPGEFSLLSPESRDALEGFRDGVNAYGARAADSGALPVECLLLGYTPEPWQVEDSVAIGKLLGWMLSLSLRAKLVLGLLAQEPRLSDLLPFSPEQGGHILADLLWKIEDVVGPLSSGGGSNSWVVAGTHTASGKPLLANDPHLPLGLPSFWYQVALRGGGFQVAGVTFPGIPGILIGATSGATWGFTNAMADDADLYLETLHPSDPHRYLFRGEWRQVSVRDEEIRVRGEGRPRRSRLRFIPRGGVLCPLLTDILPEEEQRALRNASAHRALSLRWAGFSPSRGYDALLLLNRAQTVEEIARALPGFHTPIQNVLCADREGHIAYFLMGALPHRAASGKGIFCEGSTGEQEWNGFLSWGSLPRRVDPPGGILVTANNKIVDMDREELLGHLWDPPYRAERIRQLLRTHDPVDGAVSARIQQDVYSLHAEEVIRELVTPLSPHLSDRASRSCATDLLAWDRLLDRDSSGAALFQIFYHLLLRRVFQERLDHVQPGLFTRYFSLLQIPVLPADAVLRQKREEWMGGSPETVVAEVLAEAWTRWQEGFAGSPPRSVWGTFHTLTLSHPLGRGEGWLLRSLTRLLRWNRGPYALPGDGLTVNATSFPLTGPFRVVIGASYRQVVDLGDPARSRWVIPGGISGDPLSPHYADQLPLWLRGELPPFPFPGCRQGEAEAAFRLVPHGSRVGRRIGGVR